jgi:hypothetical protein
MQREKLWVERIDFNSPLEISNSCLVVEAETGKTF